MEILKYCTDPTLFYFYINIFNVTSFNKQVWYHDMIPEKLF